MDGVDTNEGFDCGGFVAADFEVRLPWWNGDVPDRHGARHIEPTAFLMFGSVPML